MTVALVRVSNLGNAAGKAFRSGEGSSLSSRVDLFVRELGGSRTLRGVFDGDSADAPVQVEIECGVNATAEPVGIA